LTPAAISAAVATPVLQRWYLDARGLHSVGRR
jgi:hypothetical protein